jgi:hypothetical protein
MNVGISAKTFVRPDPAATLDALVDISRRLGATSR